MSQEGHSGGQPPIIIKRIKKGGHGHHGGAWKVAYADMVTALMALFIVLWILSQSDEVTRAVAGYFRDPVGFVTGGQPSIAEGGSTAGGIAVLEGTQPQSRTSPVEAEKDEKEWRERARSILQSLAESPEFEKFRQQVELAMTPDGLSITLIESNESPLFAVGGSALNPDADKLLRTIAVEIAKLDNHISIEGHTDGRVGEQAGNDSNWEISTGRAHTTRRVLVESGIEAKRIYEVRGLADNLLYNPLDPEDSRNRRVSITLLSKEAYDRRRRELETSVLGDELL